MAKLNKPTHMTHGSVLDDLGFSPEKAAVLKMKAEIGARLTSRMSKESSCRGESEAACICFSGVAQHISRD
jgi:hypothetical protein